MQGNEVIENLGQILRERRMANKFHLSERYNILRWNNADAAMGDIRRRIVERVPSIGRGQILSADDAPTRIDAGIELELGPASSDRVPKRTWPEQMDPLHGRAGISTSGPGEKHSNSEHSTFQHTSAEHLKYQFFTNQSLITSSQYTRKCVSRHNQCSASYKCRQPLDMPVPECLAE
jgi:hypothetical protein